MWAFVRLIILTLPNSVVFRLIFHSADSFHLFFKKLGIFTVNNLQFTLCKTKKTKKKYFDQYKYCLDGVQFNTGRCGLTKTQTAPYRQRWELPLDAASWRWNRLQMEIDKDNDRMMNGVVVWWKIEKMREGRRDEKLGTGNIHFVKLNKWTITTNSLRHLYYHCKLNIKLSSCGVRSYSNSTRGSLSSIG